MTIAEVMAAQRAGKFNAAGRYQMISGTLASAVKELGLSGDTKIRLKGFWARHDAVS